MILRHVNKREIVKKNGKISEKKFRILLPKLKGDHIENLRIFAIRSAWRQVVSRVDRRNFPLSCSQNRTWTSRFILLGSSGSWRYTFTLEPSYRLSSSAVPNHIKPYLSWVRQFKKRSKRTPTQKKESNPKRTLTLKKGCSWQLTEMSFIH
jgi:hypothetical protein